MKRKGRKNAIRWFSTRFAAASIHPTLKKTRFLLQPRCWVLTHKKVRGRIFSWDVYRSVKTTVQGTVNRLFSPNQISNEVFVSVFSTELQAGKGSQQSIFWGKKFLKQKNVENSRDLFWIKDLFCGIYVSYMRSKRYVILHKKCLRRLSVTQWIFPQLSRISWFLIFCVDCKSRKEWLYERCC